MVLALLADLHANLEAVSACLERARSEGAERLAFLGDLVGYGADPEAVLELVMAAADDGAIVVRGNHDAAAVGHGAERMTANAEEAIRWTQRRLPARQRAFLRSLPLVVRDGARLFAHASAEDPGSWRYVTDAHAAQSSLDAARGAEFVASGHVHEPALYAAAPASLAARVAITPGRPIALPSPGRALVIAGSVGQPRDGNPDACLAILDVERGLVTFHRVPYDWRTAARKIRDAGLPESLARRLEPRV